MTVVERELGAVLEGERLRIARRQSRRVDPTLAGRTDRRGVLAGRCKGAAGERHAAVLAHRERRGIVSRRTYHIVPGVERAAPARLYSRRLLPGCRERRVRNFHLCRVTDQNPRASGRIRCEVRILDNRFAGL